MRAMNTVVAAGREDVSHLAGLAAAYTWDTPAAAWLVPEIQDRPQVLVAWYSLLVEQALRRGHADWTGDRRAAAIWLDNTRPALTLPHYLGRLTAACGRHAIPLLTYQRLLERCGPRGGHLQLVVLAGDAQSAHQLLARRHRSLDRSGTAAFTAAADAAQVKVLTAAGYKLVPPCRLPGGPELLLMRRPPARANLAPAAAAGVVGKTS